VTRLTRAASIELIEQRYFGSVMRADVPAVMACFTPDARVLIRHGDLPPRHFGATPAPGESPLVSFYEHICGQYDCWFGEFAHTIDTRAQRAASLFQVRLKPRPGGLYAGSPVQRLSNCNFFDFTGGRIGRMLIYYSNPEAGARAGSSPTGYPLDLS
jgi:hypothetical protein